MCHNPNIGFMAKCEMQGPMRLRVCLGVKHTSHKWGKVQGRKPNDSQVHFHFMNCMSYECLKPWLKRQTNTKLGPQYTIIKVLNA